MYTMSLNVCVCPTSPRQGPSVAKEEEGRRMVSPIFLTTQIAPDTKVSSDSVHVICRYVVGDFDITLFGEDQATVVH